MSQPVNAIERKNLTLPAEPDLLAQCVKVNREWLRSLLIQRDRSGRAAVRCLASPNLSDGLEKAARVAVALSFGAASDRVRIRSILRTQGADCEELRSCLADTFGRIHHPAAAFLLLPMLNDDSWLVREPAFRSLLALHHPMTSESLLAAIWADHGLLDNMFQVTRRLTQRECNGIFESLEQASIHEPRLATTLQLIHSFVNTRTLSSRTGHGSGCLIAAKRLQQSIARDAQTNDRKELMDNWAYWNAWQIASVQNSLLEQRDELKAVSDDIADQFNEDVPSASNSEPCPFSLSNVPQQETPGTADNDRSWPERLSYLARSRAGKKLTVVTSVLLAVGFGVSRYQSSLQATSPNPRLSEPSGVLRVSQKPDAEPAIGLSVSSAKKPSSEQSERTEIEAAFRISASSRQRD
jgi:hypothetical protein